MPRPPVARSEVVWLLAVLGSLLPIPVAAGVLPAPDTLRVHVTAAQRTRYEHLFNRFRGGTPPGDDRGLALRTRVEGGVGLGRVTLRGEVLDARMPFLGDDTPVNTGLANPLDVLQAHVEIVLPDPLGREAATRLRAGRFTMDLGSRRLVARNRFRNTISAFTGLDLERVDAGGRRLRAFLTVPVQRRPTSADDLREQRLRLDRESTGTLFWGLFAASDLGDGGLRGEAWLLGLRETDEDDVATADRRLWTPGLRVLRPPAPGRTDFEVEVAFQAGTSRATSRPDDDVDLDHRAWFAHAAVGRTFPGAWRPRAVAAYDHASGDADPGDGENGRFDTLFGARRFDFGPTGLYGAFARSNLGSPGFRLEARPRTSVEGFLAWRAFWLARARDAWVGSGLADPSGASGTVLGHQMEAMARWRPRGGPVSLEAGAVRLWRSGLARHAPEVASREGEPTYVYLQVEVGG